MTTGSTDLRAMLATLEATKRPDEYVYAVVDRDHPVVPLSAATVAEDEGLTVVLRRPDADTHGVRYEFVAAWLTLTVHSSLEAVGLTAAFSTALGEAGISCNVMAGFHHDHLLVPATDAGRALEVLSGLRTQN
ncbi:hypothetical protein HD599_001818 [Conyzicola lurida]|uniref:Aspartate kinase n=1 Tax=Conyzicola lurida TaxID=1172621 RepID=A0A841APL2_9MICO|nr:ACT domain-containing protein [Conyzicola lurida]MBB5843495.1 hypothetical protein [Conyzicola lurida]